MTNKAMRASRREPVFWLVATLLVMTWSVLRGQPFVAWFAEALWVVLGLPILMSTYARFPLSNLSYRLLAAFAIVILVGAHYTYARVPIGEWARGWFGFHRNHYDRLAHAMQGAVPAIVFRELLIRTSGIGPGRTKWRPVIVTGMCLGLAALFELFEWGWAVGISDLGPKEDLGAQGDKWDTQWDMFDALVGSVTAQLLLARAHDRSLAMLGRASTTSR